MNKKIILIIIAFLGVSFAFTSCVKQNFTVPPQQCPGNSLTANTTISQLKNMYTGDTTQINDSVIVQGVVISCDKAGNFYKELVIEDATGGIAIQVDASYLYLKYPLGQKIYIKCGGLYLGKSYGAIKIGSLYTQYDIVQFGRIQGNVEINDHILSSCDNTPEDPKVVTLSQINDLVLYKLIKINNVQFTKSELGETYADAVNLADVDHHIVDANKNSLVVRVSGYAKFARDTIPKGNGSIVGVLETYNGTYQLMIRDTSDVNFTAQRFVEPIVKNFNDGDLYSGGWTQYNVKGVSWTLGTYQGKSYLDASNYDYSTNINTASETWFISPKLDLSKFKNPFLSFDNAYKYQGAPLEVKYSLDYDGVSAPSTATWTSLNPTLSSGNFIWTPSGNLSLSKNIKYIAFIYKGSSSDGSHWEVDNILIDDAGK